MSEENETEEEGVGFSEGDSTLVNWDETEEIKFEVMPRGMYDCVINDCEFNFSQAKGNPMWSIELEVTSGEFAGRTLYSHMVFAGKGLGFTKAALGRIRPDLVQGTMNPEDPDVIASMLGMNVRAKVTIKPYEGEDRNNVRGLYPPSEDAAFVS